MGRELICPGAALLAPEARRAQAIPTGTVEGNTEVGLLPRNKETTKTLVIHLKASRTLENGPYPRNGHPAPPSLLPPLTPHPNGTFSAGAKGSVPGQGKSHMPCGCPKIKNRKLYVLEYIYIHV